MPYIPTAQELNAIPSAPAAAPPKAPAAPQQAPAAPQQASSGGGGYTPTAQELNAIPTAANDGQGRVGRAARGLLEQDGGRFGCATTACRALTAAGIPFPSTANARDMESKMAANGFVRVAPDQADVLFGAGSGPSGRHVMLGAGNGRTIEDPGGMRGTTIQFGQIPTHDASLTGYKYVGSSSSLVQRSPQPIGASLFPAHAMPPAVPAIIPTQPPAARASPFRPVAPPMQRGANGDPYGDPGSNGDPYGDPANARVSPLRPAPLPAKRGANGDPYGDPGSAPAARLTAGSYQPSPTPFTANDFTAATSHEPAVLPSGSAPSGTTPSETTPSASTLAVNNARQAFLTSRQATAHYANIRNNPAATSADLTSAYTNMQGAIKEYIRTNSAVDPAWFAGPDHQKFLTDVLNDGTLSSDEIKSVLTLPKAAPPKAADPNDPASRSFVDNILPSAARFGKGILGLPMIVGDAAERDVLGLGNMAQKIGDAAMYAGNSVAGNKAAAAGYERAANRAEARETTMFGPVMDELKGTMGTGVDLTTAAANYAGGQPAEGRRVLKSILPNTLQALHDDPVQTIANGAMLLGGIGGGLSKAGALADVAGQARLGAGLSKAGAAASYVASGGPLGTLAGKGVGAAASAILRKLPPKTAAALVRAAAVGSGQMPPTQGQKPAEAPAEVSAAQPAAETAAAPAAEVPEAQAPAVKGAAAKSTTAGDDSNTPAPVKPVAAKTSITDGTGVKFTPVKNTSKEANAAVDPKTGMTKAQQDYLTFALENYVNTPEAHTPDLGAKIEPHTIYVPGKGAYTVTGAEQANALHVNLTGEGLKIPNEFDGKKLSTLNETASAEASPVNPDALKALTDASDDGAAARAAKKNVKPAAETAPAETSSDTAPVNPAVLKMLQDEAKGVTDARAASKPKPAPVIAESAPKVAEATPPAVETKPKVVETKPKAAAEAATEAAGTPAAEEMPTHNYKGQKYADGTSDMMRKLLSTPPTDGADLKPGDVVVSKGMNTHTVTGVEDGIPVGRTIGAGGKKGRTVQKIDGGWPESSGPNEFHILPPEVVEARIAKGKPVPVAAAAAEAAAKVAEAASASVPAETVPTPAERVATETHITDGTGAKFTPTQNDAKAPGTSVDPKTGMTKTQQDYLTTSLENYVNTPEAHIPAPVTDAQAASNAARVKIISDNDPVKVSAPFLAEQNALNNSVAMRGGGSTPAELDQYRISRSNQDHAVRSAAARVAAAGPVISGEVAPHTIEIPGDGKYTVTGAKQANALHVNLTGKGLTRTTQIDGTTLDKPADLNDTYKHKSPPVSGNKNNSGNTESTNHSRGLNGEVADPGLPSIKVAAKDRPDVLAKYASDEPFPEPAPPKPTGFGSRNTMFTNDMADAAGKGMQKNFGGVNLVAGPGSFLFGAKDFGTFAGHLIEGGIREFGSWGQKMVDEFGKGAIPHLTTMFAEATKNRTNPVTHNYQVRMGENGLVGYEDKSRVIEAKPRLGEEAPGADKHIDWNEFLKTITTFIPQHYDRTRVGWYIPRDINSGTKPIYLNGGTSYGASEGRNGIAAFAGMKQSHSTLLNNLANRLQNPHVAFSIGVPEMSLGNLEYTHVYNEEINAAVKSGEVDLGKLNTAVADIAQNKLFVKRNLDIKSWDDYYKAATMPGSVLTFAERRFMNETLGQQSNVKIGAAIGYNEVLDGFNTHFAVPNDHVVAVAKVMQGQGTGQTSVSLGVPTHISYPYSSLGEWLGVSHPFPAMDLFGDAIRARNPNPKDYQTYAQRSLAACATIFTQSILDKINYHMEARQFGYTGTDKGGVAAGGAVAGGDNRGTKDSAAGNTGRDGKDGGPGGRPDLSGTRPGSTGDTPNDAGQSNPAATQEVKGSQEVKGEPDPTTTTVAKPNAKLIDTFDKLADNSVANIKGRSRGRVSSGIDPADLVDMTIYGAAKIAKGVVNLADWTTDMVKEFGDAVRPHADALYKSAKDHFNAANNAANAGQDIQAARQKHLSTLNPKDFQDAAAAANNAQSTAAQNTAPVSPSASTTASGTTAPSTTASGTTASSTTASGTTASSTTASGKSGKAEYAGSINLDRMNISDDAKARIRSASDRLSAGEVLPRDVATAAAKALNLTPDMLDGLNPGEVPSGVHPVIFDKALRDLHAKTEEDTTQVLKDTHGDVSPDATNKRNAALALADKLFLHDNARSRIAGQSLSGRNMVASAQDAAVEAVREKQEALANVMALTHPQRNTSAAPAAPVKVEAPAPTPAGTAEASSPAAAASTPAAAAAPATTPAAAPATVTRRFITDEVKDAALARIRASRGQINAGIDPGLIKDAITVGAYHVESGIRAFGAWVQKMKQDVPGLSAEQTRTVYAAARAQHTADTLAKIKDTGNLIFGDALKASGMKPKDTANFFDALVSHPVHPDLLPKMLSGDALSASEQAAINQAYNASAPAKGAGAAKAPPTPQSVTQVTQLAAQVGKAAAGGTPKVTDPFMQAVTGRVGKGNADEFVKRLADDADTTNAEANIRAGQPLTRDEARGVAINLDDLKASKSPPNPSAASKILSQIVKDANAGRLGADLAKPPAPRAPRTAAPTAKRTTPAKPVDPVMQTLKARLGQKNADEFVRRLAADPNTVNTIAKLRASQPLTAGETKSVTDLLNTLASGKAAPKPQSAVSKQLTQAVNAAKVVDPVMKTLTGRLGKTNAGEFLKRLAADPETAGTEAKMRSGTPLTDKETRMAAQHLDDLKGGRNVPGAPSDISKTLSKAVRDAKAGRLGYDSAKEVVRQELMDHADPKHLAAIRTALANVSGNSERELAQIYARYHPSSPSDKYAFLLRSGLLSGPLTLKSILVSHLLGAGIEDTVTRAAAALSDPFIKFLLGDKDDTGGRSVQGFNVAATAAAIKAGIKAIPEGYQYVKDGPTALQLKGMSPGYKWEDDRPTGLDHEPVSGPQMKGAMQDATPAAMSAALGALGGKGLGRVGAAVGSGAGKVAGKIMSSKAGVAAGTAVGVGAAFPPRMHGAVFHVIGSALEVRGRMEAAALKAQRIGGNPVQYLHDADVTKAALKYRQEELYMNPNGMATVFNAATQRVPAYIKNIGTSLAPFVKVPANIAMRGAEYTGAGAVLGPARALRVRMTGKDFASFDKKVAPDTMTPDERAAALLEFRRSAAMQTGRGIAGAGLGLTAGYFGAKSGVLTAPNEKQHEYGRANVGNYSFDTARLEPAMTAPMLGAEIYNKTHGKGYDLAAPFTSSPMFRVGDTLTGIKESGGGKLNTMERAAGQILSAYIPTLLSQVASYSDPSGETRKKAALSDYFANKLPIAREGLKTTGREQPTNYKKTALLGLLSPVAVETRKPEPAPEKHGRGNAGADPFGSPGRSKSAGGAF